MADNLTIRFYQDKLLMGFKSEQAGHPVYEDTDFVEITIPGDMNNVIVRPATDNDKRQHAALFSRYKEGLEPSVDGVPLEAWSRLTPASVANYKAMGVKTVEHVAGMSDQICNKVAMGAMADRTAAKAYLSLAKDSALAQKQAVEIERQNQTIADLQRQISELAALADAPKRGRAAKQHEEA
ncbi:MAG: hypothetical protein KGI54_08945 [Pseudomonadota bacterium]|nr:hypothetical protein [Pseudomonadota bacterium]